MQILQHEIQGITSSGVYAWQGRSGDHGVDGAKGDKGDVGLQGQKGDQVRGGKWSKQTRWSSFSKPLFLLSSVICLFFTGRLRGSRVTRGQRGERREGETDIICPSSLSWTLFICVLTFCRVTCLSRVSEDYPDTSGTQASMEKRLDLNLSLITPYKIDVCDVCDTVNVVSRQNREKWEYPAPLVCLDWTDSRVARWSLSLPLFPKHVQCLLFLYFIFVVSIMGNFRAIKDKVGPVVLMVNQEWKGKGSVN